MVYNPLYDQSILLQLRAHIKLCDMCFSIGLTIYFIWGDNMSIRIILYVLQNKKAKAIVLDIKHWWHNNSLSHVIINLTLIQYSV